MRGRGRARHEAERLARLAPRGNGLSATRRTRRAKNSSRRWTSTTTSARCAPWHLREDPQTRVVRSPSRWGWWPRSSPRQSDLTAIFQGAHPRSRPQRMRDEPPSLGPPLHSGSVQVMHGPGAGRPARRRALVPDRRIARGHPGAECGARDTASSWPPAASASCVRRILRKAGLRVGPGNVPAYVEKTAYVPKAVKTHRARPSTRHAVLVEQSIVCDEAIKDQVIAEVKKNGGYFLRRCRGAAVSRVVVHSPAPREPRDRRQARALHCREGRDQGPPETRALVARWPASAATSPLDREAVPVLAFYVVRDWHEAASAASSSFVTAAPAQPRHPQPGRPSSGVRGSGSRSTGSSPTARPPWAPPAIRPGSLLR